MVALPLQVLRYETEEERVAELRVVQKRPNIWPWIVLLVVTAILVWALVEYYGGENTEVIEERPVGALRIPPPMPPVAAALAL
jgi:hypothetical protein